MKLNLNTICIILTYWMLMNLYGNPKNNDILCASENLRDLKRQNIHPLLCKVLQFRENTSPYFLNISESLRVYQDDEKNICILPEGFLVFLFLNVKSSFKLKLKSLTASIQKFFSFSW